MYVYRCPFCGLWRIKSSSGISITKLEKAFKRGWRDEEGSIKAQPLRFDFIDIEHDPILIEKKGKAIIGKWNIYEAYLNLPEEERQYFLGKLVEILRQCNKIKRVVEEVFNIKLEEA
jgi:hypothetical protein